MTKSGTRSTDTFLDLLFNHRKPLCPPWQHPLSQAPLDLTLEQWREEQRHTSSIGSCLLDEGAVALATAEATALTPPETPGADPLWTHGLAAHRLAGLPVFAYGESLEAAVGDGIWSDGLHIWVAQSSLARLRRQDLATPLTGVAPAALPLSLQAAALLAAARTVLPASTSPTEDFATNPAVQGELRAPKAWSQVRSALAGLPNGKALLARWPEADWSDADVAAIQETWPTDFEDARHLDAWWSTALATPLSTPVHLPSVTPGANPLDGVNGAAWRRETERAWQAVAAAIRRADPDRFRYVLRWLDVAEDASLTDDTLLLWARRCRVWTHPDSNSKDMDGLRAAAAEWSHSSRYTHIKRELMMHAATSSPQDGACAARARASWLGMLAEIRDGVLPSDASAHGIPWLDVAQRLFDDDTFAQWSRFAVAAKPGAFKPAEAWKSARTEEEALRLLDAKTPVTVEAFDPDLDEKAGTTPLHRAAKRWSPEVVRRLLEAGANPSARDCGDVSPLMVARHPDTVRLLLAAGASVDECAEQGWKPRKTRASRQTVKRTASKYLGRTPFLGAAIDGYPHKEATLRALLAAGADARARTPAGWTALSLMLSGAHAGSWGASLTLMLSLDLPLEHAAGEPSLLQRALQNGKGVGNPGAMGSAEFLSGVRALLAAGVPYRSEQASPCTEASSFPDPHLAVETLKLLIHHPDASYARDGERALSTAATEEARTFLEGWRLASELEKDLPDPSPTRRARM